MRALLILLLLAALPSFAWAEPRSEYEMKAAYLYNFSLIVEWPEETFDAFTICLFGEKEQFGNALTIIEKKTVRNKPVAIQQTTSLVPLKKCQVVFISEHESHQMDRILKELGKHPVITVTESPRSVGGMIRLALDKQRLVFDIDLDQVNKTDLKFSYKLLNLARNLRNRNVPEPSGPGCRLIPMWGSPDSTSDRPCQTTP